MEWISVMDSAFKPPNRPDNTAEKQTCIQTLHDLSRLLDYETQYKPLLEYITNH